MKGKQQYDDDYEPLDDTVIMLTVMGIVSVGIFMLIYIGVF